MNPNKALEVVRMTRGIHGWFSFEAAMLFAWIDDIQKRNGVAGDVFEIGVHHGKSAVLLGAMIQPEREILGVCDVFGDQLQNVSRSGSGDRGIFERNMKTSFHDSLAVRIFAKPSKDIGVEDIGTNYRFFHIDGGHTPEEAFNDLQLAAASTVKEGVIVLDDPLRPEWPGVSEALFRFLTSNKEFCAIVVGFNKMILTRCESADQYVRDIDKVDRQIVYNLLYPWHMKISRFFNYPIRIFYIPTYLSGKSIPAKAIRVFQIDRWTHTPFLRPVIRIARLAKAMLP
jgi:hypothetical protein